MANNKSPRRRPFDFAAIIGGPTRERARNKCVPGRGLLQRAASGQSRHCNGSFRESRHKRTEQRMAANCRRPFVVVGAADANRRWRRRRRNWPASSTKTEPTCGLWRAVGRADARTGSCCAFGKRPPPSCSRRTADGKRRAPMTSGGKVDFCEGSQLRPAAACQWPNWSSHSVRLVSAVVVLVAAAAAAAHYTIPGEHLRGSQPSRAAPRRPISTRWAQEAHASNLISPGASCSPTWPTAS